MLALLNLTKPRISLLFAITALAALLLEGSLSLTSLHLWMIVFSVFLVGGCANAFNQYFERDLDEKMIRTAQRRPLPLKKISPNQALVFTILIGILGLQLLYTWGGGFAFGLGLFTILFYSFFYTLYLKPKTPYNIVIGGVAGAMGPLIAWAAVQNTVSWEAWVLFLIIFMWTPPHFWALAIYYKEDYEKIGLPMLPVVKGVRATQVQILAYSVFLLPLSLLLTFSEKLGWFYLAVSFLVNIYFIKKAFDVYQSNTRQVAYRLFALSIGYLFILLLALMLDATVV
ncbi:MAG: protoheme IX farnesyltransferase [Deltaproteobacteria bacterium RIFCSPHIGHO2_02_FULL_40_11]|nr:MAG: protoheme IX farnesyltransferase [Deltaproteobacteria bacterium RIFCSPHIGHO2_02_FULL_40_11]